MTTIVLDATELSRDWLCRGLKYQLLENANFHWLNVVVPRSALEEVVANHRRQVDAADQALRNLGRERVRLGMSAPESESSSFDYREYLDDRFDRQLGISVLPWPTVSHSDLVSRAVSRTPPFDEKGGGYRDALIWASVVQLASEGHTVALVSADRAFADKDGNLANLLAREIAPLAGSVELVRDFGAWLLERVPWEVESLQSAVAISMSERFYEYFLQSDYDSYLEPAIEDLGFSWAPLSCKLIETTWNGSFTTAETRTGPDGLAVVEFDVGQTVTFEAVFDRGVPAEPNWDVDEPDILGHVRVDGTVEMTVRIVVVFGDEFGMSVDEETWRREDGSGPGASVVGLDPNQLSLLEMDD